MVYFNADAIILSAIGCYIYEHLLNFFLAQKHDIDVFPPTVVSEESYS